jgi:hypothetical protein
MAFTVTQAKSLCTIGELSLARASTGDEIGKFSIVQIQQKVDRARKLRDKWRDQAEKQRRTTQATQRARDTSANARSTEKATLFGEVLARFEAQLATLEAKGAQGRPAPKRLPARARSATHRADRADIRGELKEERLALGGSKTTKAAKPTRPKAPAAAAPTPADETETAAIQTAAKRRSKPTTLPAARSGRGKRAHAGTGMTAIESARELQGLHVTKGKQLRAGSAAKKSRLQASGMMRVQKNASARNKRSQGKRDSR